MRENRDMGLTSELGQHSPFGPSIMRLAVMAVMLGLFMFLTELMVDALLASLDALFGELNDVIISVDD
jgi:hypothetical protein